MLIDSHCHLQDSQFDDDRDEVIERARQSGISAFIIPGTDLDSSRQAVDLADSHSDVFAAIGVHPHHAPKFNSRTLATLRRLADSPKVVAIGEIGLDYYRDLAPRGDQLTAFRKQLELALELRLPVVAHSRSADQETFDLLAAYEAHALPRWSKERPLGIMHCFAGDLRLALRYIHLGFLISIPGTCTYSKAERLRAVAGGIPLRWMAVETDSPYLPPQPHRGRRNEPAYLPETVKHIAKLRGDTFENVARRTALATAGLFGLGDIGEIEATQSREGAS